jgi:serine/threonine protein kinase
MDGETRMPDQFHRYQIIQGLAQKYSHTTYLAYPIHDPERQVVLIVFSPSLLSSLHERQALLKRAQSLTKLQNPHLLPILDAGIVEKQPFVVREYVPHQSLRSYLKQLAPKRLKLSDVLSLLLQVGEALVYAHSHQIVHGNLKPENILLDADGHAFLTDFDLLTRSDVMMRDQTTEEYAFCYLAPEQFAGTWDAYADQYALGCLFYELITGEVPSATKSLTSLINDQSYYVQPAPLSEKVPHLPTTLEAAVLKALAKNPSDRFGDLSLFLEVIRTVASPPPAFPLSRPKTPDQQKPHSRLAQPSNAPDSQASTCEEATSDYPLSHKRQTSSAISVAESESLVDDIFEDVLDEEYSQNPLVLKSDEVIEALPLGVDQAKPMAKGASGQRKILLSVILIGLIITTIAVYPNIFSIKTINNPIHPTQPVRTSRSLIPQSIPGKTEISLLPISSKITPTVGTSRNLVPQSTSTPLSISLGVTPRSGEIYNLVNRNSNKLLEEVSNSLWDDQSSPTGCVCQNWAFCSANNPNYPGSFFIYNMAASPGPQASNDHVLGVADSSPKYQIGLAQIVPAPKPTLYWLLQSTPDGYYNLINERDKAYADVFLGSPNDMAAVMLYWPNGKSDEQWQLSDTGKPFICPVVN